MKFEIIVRILEPKPKKQQCERICLVFKSMTTFDNLDAHKALKPNSLTIPFGLLLCEM